MTSEPEHIEKLKQNEKNVSAQEAKYLLLNLMYFRFAGASLSQSTATLFIQMPASSTSNNNNKYKSFEFFFSSIRLKRNFILPNSKPYFHNKYSILNIKNKPNKWKITNGHGNKTKMRTRTQI